MTNKKEADKTVRFLKLAGHATLGKLRMSVRLKTAMEELLSDWHSDLREPWRALLGNVALDFDGIAPELKMEIWEQIFPVRCGKHFPGMPVGTHCLRAFDGISPDDIRCVVLGLVPYPEPGFATGHAFEAGNLRCVLRDHPAFADNVLSRPNPFILCNNFLKEMGSPSQRTWRHCYSNPA